MSIINKIEAQYVAPALVTYEVRTEQGFSLSAGSVIESVDGRLEEESWE